MSKALRWLMFWLITGAPVWGFAVAMILVLIAGWLLLAGAP